jgi:glyoxylate reductase
MNGLRDADGILCLLTDPMNEEVLTAAPKLRIISNLAVGYNNIDIAAATRLGIPVGNTPGVLTEATADLAFALMIAAARCLRAGLEDIANHKWRTWEPLGYLGQELTGKTLGIVGLGRIGTALARRCRGGWSMRVLYHNPRRQLDAERELDAKFVDIETLLRESDFVSLHCPATPTNRHLMSRAQFQAMKPSAVFVNTARGALVDQSALQEALTEGWIFAAGIDVTDPEPPQPDDPLLQLPNLVVMPHIASATAETRNQMAVLAAENLLAGLAGRPLPNLVNKDVVPRFT